MQLRTLEFAQKNLSCSFHTHCHHILEENLQMLVQVSQKEVDQFVELILKSSTIVVCGAGRMGMMARAFAMRLKHLNFDAYHIHDCNTPRIKENDLLIAASGSGETKTIVTLVQLAKTSGASIALITAQSSSSMSRLSDVSVLLPILSSQQPMTTLMEQSSLLFFDAVVLILMNQLRQTEETLKARHSILE
jgi:6-phospho-3-hexuloisomerase